MKIIHCADIHLDSKMTSNLDKEKAKIRKGELVLTFKRMVEYAVSNCISAILICGDLFDSKVISAYARNAVLTSINENPGIDFFYIKGNHDSDGFIDSIRDIPENMHLFNESWTSYSLSKNGKIKLHGCELLGTDSAKQQASFAPNPMDINIVMLHGQVAETSIGEKTEIIDLRKFRNKGINYLALGHIHEYRTEVLDGEGKYCYSGCLEGRGFDECSSHGFVVLDIDEYTGVIKDDFIPFASRNLFTVYVDISGLNNSQEIISTIKDKLTQNPEIRSKDMIKIVLTGEVGVDCEKDIDFITQAVFDEYFFVKVCDESGIYIDYESYLLDESLKGEFVRLVKASNHSEEKKAEIIKLGLHVLSGGKAEE